MTWRHKQASSPSVCFLKDTIGEARHVCIDARSWQSADNIHTTSWAEEKINGSHPSLLPQQIWGQGRDPVYDFIIGSAQIFH